MPRLRQPKFTGLFYDESRNDSVWIREQGRLRLPPLSGEQTFVIIGEILAPDPADPTAAGPVGLTVRFNGRRVSHQPDLPPGPFRLAFTGAATGENRQSLTLKLQGVTAGNYRAWLGRVTGQDRLRPWRAQARNRRLRIQRVEADGETLYDFSNRASPWNTTAVRRYLKLGLNLVGYYRAVLGVGESVRCAARSAEAAGLPLACVDLKLPCTNPLTDTTFVARLQTDHPYPVNVIHHDAPVARDIDHYHGPGLRTGRYNIGYWAWELPEFPDAWINCADYLDEIWTPSQFATAAIAEKVRVPVLTMPHSLSFARPTGNCRAKFGLPADQYLFLFLYDLNSYSERKNPAAVVEAFRLSGLAAHGAALVIKVHNTAANPADFQRLQAAVATLPGTRLITDTLSRQELYELEAACDCFVSLHRSEGFGLAVAECMYLGKPVISTDWSATAEYVHADNGCPVRCRLVTLDRNHGPYAKGQTWADPDLAHAAEWMQKLVADRALGARLGAAARVTMETHYSPAAIGARYRRRLEAIAGWE